MKELNTFKKYFRNYMTLWVWLRTAEHSTVRTFMKISWSGKKAVVDRWIAWHIDKFGKKPTILMIY